MTEQPDLSEPKSQTEVASTISEPPLPPSWSYEATVTEVETIINHIERGELPLAELFSQFAVAVEHLRQCETFLTRQQQQVDLLIETLLDESELF